VPHEENRDPQDRFGQADELGDYVLQRSLQSDGAGLRVAQRVVGQRQGTADVTIAALEDLAEQCLESGDPDGAAARLAQARVLLHGDLVFGWRLELKHQLISARLALLRGDAERALAGAGDLTARAAELGVPRYTSVARLLAHRANHALGVPVDPAAVAADLDLLDRCVAVEAWWWTGDVATGFARLAWLDRAADRAARLARASGRHADGLLREADRRLGRRRTAVD
jgi:hypothetical protein